MNEGKEGQVIVKEGAAQCSLCGGREFEETLIMEAQVAFWSRGPALVESEDYSTPDIIERKDFKCAFCHAKLEVGEGVEFL